MITIIIPNKQEEDRDEDWGHNTDKLPSIIDACTRDEETPPQHHLAKIVGLHRMFKS